MCSGKKHNSTGSCKEDTKVSFIRECIFLVTYLSIDYLSIVKKLNGWGGWSTRFDLIWKLIKGVGCDSRMVGLEVEICLGVCNNKNIKETSPETLI